MCRSTSTVTRARCWHRTPRGIASVEWERGPGGWRFEASVPDGSEARIVVPSAQRTLGSGHHVVTIPV
ncbi:alpha-L-rhamnosidase C-terminal domain-containing protein [Microcella sp.]|uniref:alpha-L-rhamnosidase C-terminal domain-containing protein n=1 Tax=Microcella sp. TaxID=1913979 RepID=UPI003F6EB43E